MFKIFESKNNKVTLNTIPLGILIFLVLALLKVLGVIGWSWGWVLLVAAAPTIFVLILCVVSMACMFGLFFVAWIVKGCPKIKWTVKDKSND